MTDTPQKFGKWMIIAAWLLVLGLLTLFFNNVLDNQNNPNKELVAQKNSDGSREVTLQRNQEGHYVAPGTINNEPVVFFLDTGATVVSIPSEVAKHLQLKRGLPMEVETANGTVTVYSTELDKVTLGPIELRRVKASINPQMEDHEVLLGMSFLKRLEFSQRGETLILHQFADKK